MKIGNILKHIITGLILWLSVGVNAQHVEQKRRGTDIESVYYGPFVVEDHEWDYMQTNASWSDDFTNHQVKSYITLEREGEEGPEEYFDNAWTYEIQFDVTGFNLTTGIPEATTTETLKITYDPALNYTDVDVVEIAGYHRFLVDNIQVVGPHPFWYPGGTPDDIVLTGHVEVERYYTLDVATAPSVAKTQNAVTNELDLTWNFFPGAEEYDVEWLYNYDGTSSTPTAADFRKRATRVTTENNYYSLSLIYESFTTSSKLFYRVRPVGKGGADFDKRVEGSWSTIQGHAVPKTTGSIVDSLSLVNWQYGATYAEHGKKSETVSFFDGSGRLRQTVVKNNTDNTTVVAETYYDFEGRPALNSIPSPTGDNVLKYYSDYSMNMETTAKPYSKLDFDVASQLNAPRDMSHKNTGHNYAYFSTDNADLTNEHAYLPDAEGNGYSRTLYGMDGRVKQTSGVGEDFKIGSGHEVNYYYGTPSQVKLDRLFGSEVGYARHYKVNAVEDPNGQISVTYTNLSGQTIATALAGATPQESGADMVDALSYQTEQPTIYDDLTNLNTYHSSLPDYNDMPGWIIRYPLFVSTTGNYNFEYDVTSLRYINLCDTTIAHGCKYDLIIRIVDDCNNELHKETLTYDTGEGAVPLTITPVTFTQNFTTPGTYYVEKVLTLNSERLEQELIDFVAIIDNCVTTSDYDYTLDLSECDECEDGCTQAAGSQAHLNCLKECNELNDECSALLEQMQIDMSPGGYYFQTGQTGWLEDYAWSTTTEWTNSGWGVTSWTDAEANWDETWVEPCEAGGESSEFGTAIDHWENDWNGTGKANCYIEYHPEFCHYRWCNESEVQASRDFDHELWLMTYTHAKNTNFGYVSSGLLNANFDDNDPFWDAITPMDNIDGFETTLEGKISDFTGTGISMWDYAEDLAGTDCAGSTTGCDEHWQMFVQLYTTTKWEILDDYKTSATGYGCPYLIDVSPFDGITDDPGGCETEPTELDLITENVDPDLNVYKHLTAFHCMTEGSTPINYPYSHLGNMNTSGALISDFNTDSECEKLATGSFTITSGTASASVSVNSVDISGTIDLSTGSNTDKAVALVDAINNQYPASGVDYQASNSGAAVTLYAVPGSGAAVNGHSIGVTGLSTSSSPGTVEGGIDREVCLMEYYNNSNHCEQEASATITITACSTAVHLKVNGVKIIRPSNDYTFTASLLEDRIAELADTINTYISTPTDYYAIDHVDAGGDVTLTIYAVPGSGTTPNGYSITQSGLTITESPLPTLSGGTIGTNCDELAPLNCLCEELRSTLDILDGAQTVDYTVPSTSLTTADVDAIKDAYNDLFSGETSFPITSTQIKDWWDNCRTSLDEPTYGQSPEGWSGTAFTSDLVPEKMKCWLWSENCGQEEQDLEVYYSNEAYLQAIEDKKAEFIENYKAHCMGVIEGGDNSHFYDSLRLDYTDKEYHYTLYYYDQAGNLVRTVPPEGVTMLPDAQFPDVYNYREDPVTYTPVFPAHTFKTEYTHNSLNEVLTDDAPDHDGNQYWYDKIGRLRFSQDPVQQAAGKYSYMKYDNLGRVTSSGQSGDGGVTFYNNVDNMTFPSTGDFRTMSFYDETASTTIDGYFDNGQDQDHTLRNRVATVIFQRNYNADSLKYDHASHYRYDIHGNVVELYQEHPQLSTLNDGSSSYKFDRKRIEYDFDLVSGVVNQVTYQRGFIDQFMHRYEYDANNRLEKVMTSNNGFVWDEDAEYFYYKHGPLARVEIGEDKVQGCDYAYTIQGWLKGVNSEGLTASLDIGKDGYNNTDKNYGGLNNKIGKDVHGFSLGYFIGDYEDVSGFSGDKDFYGAVTSTSTLKTESSNLYNGNISRMVTNTPLKSGSIWSQSLVGYAFRYDQLHRFKRMRRSLDYNSILNSWGTAAYDPDYEVSTSFDKNGNLLSLNRDAYDPLAAGNNGMDELEYTYNASTNQLNKVTDRLGGFEQDGAMGDLMTQSDNNYLYDTKGQLIEDVTENIDNIIWRPDGKVEEIIRYSTSGVNDPDLKFEYDALGQRVLKISKPRVAGVLSGNTEWTYTYYVRDAQGNVLAVYDRDKTDPPGDPTEDDIITLKEQHLYGSSRVGMRKPDLDLGGMRTDLGPTSVPIAPASVDQDLRTKGLKSYELAEHRGNVMAVISDIRIVDDAAHTGGEVDLFTADLQAGTDYYAYGFIMPGRNSSSENYRYGFNGMEKDDEVSGSGNSYTTTFRQYDPRLGRWKSIDPFAFKYSGQSPFAGFNLNPIYWSDPTGLEGESTTDGKGVERLKFGARARNFLGGKGYVNRANRYASENNIDASRIHEGNGYVSIDESYYADAPLEHVDGMMQTSWRYMDKETIFSLGRLLRKGIGNTIEKSFYETIHNTSEKVNEAFGYTSIGIGIADYSYFSKLTYTTPNGTVANLLNKSSFIKSPINGRIGSLGGYQWVDNWGDVDALARRFKSPTLVGRANWGSFVKGGGKALGWAGVGLTVLDWGISEYEGTATTATRVETGADVTMGIVGITCGPIGWLASGVYFFGKVAIRGAEEDIQKNWGGDRNAWANHVKGGASVCFIPGTKVLVPSGSVSIDKLQIGDEVFSYNLKTADMELDTVVHIDSSITTFLYNVLLEDSTLVICTEEHPFYVQGKGWVKVRDLDNESILLSSNLSEVCILDITKLEINSSVYNLQIKRNQNYFVGTKAILVHNKRFIVGPVRYNDEIMEEHD